jgi:hypothetical protein
MNIDITKQEAWKLLDAVKSYKKDYVVGSSVDKIFESIVTKLKKIVKE